MDGCLCGGDECGAEAWLTGARGDGVVLWYATEDPERFIEQERGGHPTTVREAGGRTGVSRQMKPPTS